MSNNDRKKSAPGHTENQGGKIRCKDKVKGKARDGTVARGGEITLHSHMSLVTLSRSNKYPNPTPEGESLGTSQTDKGPGETKGASTRKP